MLCDSCVRTLRVYSGYELRCEISVYELRCETDVYELKCETGVYELSVSPTVWMGRLKLRHLGGKCRKPFDRSFHVSLLTFCMHPGSATHQLFNYYVSSSFLLVFLLCALEGVCMRVCMYVCIHVRVEARNQCQRLSTLFLFETESLAEPRAHCLDWKTNELTV